MNYHAPIALPEELKRFAGRILDVDSHEMMPAQVWVQECGPLCEPLVEEWLHNGEDVSKNANHPNCPGYSGDVAPIEAESIWLRKGSLAPGAVDVPRRDAVMDVMGVQRQLCFPTGVGMWGAFLLMNPDDRTMLPTIKTDRVKYGRDLCKAYNDWAIRATKQSNRVRFVLPALGDTVDELIREARYLIDHGIKSIWLPSCIPPGGKSPAHDDLDPFWRLMTENRIAVCLHVGPDQPYKSAEWGNAPVFEGFRILTEFRVDPWTLTANYISTQNFLATMVVGGVFERHPELRFGVIENGAYWLNNLCEIMDMWYGRSTTFGNKSETFRLATRPSDYVKRNVRVSCFDFEPVDKYVRQGFADVICFASDYPHIEGGKDPAGDWLKKLSPLGPEVLEKFFTTNAKWILPD